MSDYKVVDAEMLDADLASVADAIRTKGGTDASLTFPQGFVDGINAIESGGKEEQEKSVTITENGTTEILPDEGKTLSKVAVNVEVESGGGGNEFITMTASAVNASEAYELFKALTDEGHCYCFLYKGEPVKDQKDRQCLTFIVSKMNVAVTGYWVRYNKLLNYSGTIYSYSQNTTAYDVIINVGDVYEKVVLW